MEEQKEFNDEGFPWLWAILGTLYLFSPVDFSPDVVPVLGWVDDAVITGGAMLHIAQYYTNESYPILSKILKLVKWAVIIIGGIMLILIVLLGAVVYKLFMS